MMRLDLEWRMTYIGDYRTTERDQLLESVLVGPVTRGTHKFCFQVFESWMYWVMYRRMLLISLSFRRIVFLE